LVLGLLYGELGSIGLDLLFGKLGEFYIIFLNESIGIGFVLLCDKLGSIDLVSLFSKLVEFCSIGVKWINKGLQQKKNLLAFWFFVFASLKSCSNVCFHVLCLLLFCLILFMFNGWKTILFCWKCGWSCWRCISIAPIYMPSSSISNVKSVHI